MRRGLVTSRAEAHAAIDAGRVVVDGAPALKAATQVLPSQAVSLTAPPHRFVSRGGEKLEGALERFEIDVEGRRCLDAGASTGGFTDCLLQRGAAHVVAVDVGYGQLHHRLRTDDRVTVLERTNVRELRPQDVPPPPPRLVTADLSFISLTLVLPALRAAADAQAEAVLLVKPQFEAGREHVGRGGVVRDPEVWQRTLASVAAAASEQSWAVAGAMPSPLTGPAGNVEFLVWLRPHGPEGLAAPAIADAVAEARARSAG